MTDEKFLDSELTFESQVSDFIESCTEYGVDPTERILDVLYKNGIEV